MRKHRVVKRYANDICNSVQFEKSVLSEICCHNLAYIAKPGLFDTEPGLVNAYQAKAKLVAFLSEQLGIGFVAGDCSTAHQARVGLPGCTCCKNDVVLVEGLDSKLECGEVWLHAEAKGQCVSIVSFWKYVSSDTAKGSGVWEKQDNPAVLRTSTILSPALHSSLDSSKVRVIIPWPVRHYLSSRC
jgi:hypothetical protein